MDGPWEEMDNNKLVKCFKADKTDCRWLAATHLYEDSPG